MPEDVKDVFGFAIDQVQAGDKTDMSIFWLFEPYCTRITL